MDNNTIESKTVLVTGCRDCPLCETWESGSHWCYAQGENDDYYITDDQYDYNDLPKFCPLKQQSITIQLNKNA